MSELIPSQRFYIRIHDEEKISCQEVLKALDKYKNIIVSKAANFEDEQEFACDLSK